MTKTGHMINEEVIIGITRTSEVGTIVEMIGTKVNITEVKKC